MGELEGATMAIEFGGERFGDLTAWVGATAESAANYSLSGRLSFEDGSMLFHSVRANLGQTALTGDWATSWTDQDLRLKATVRFSHVDPAELASLFRRREKPSNQDEKPGLNLYMPVLPYGVTIVDTDLDIAAERVHLQPVDLTDLTF